MKIGICLPRYELHSVMWFSGMAHETLSATHETVFLPDEYYYARGDRQQAMLESFVRQCDVLFGSTTPAILAARQRAGSNIPVVMITSGDLPKGAFGIRAMLPHLTTNDRLLVHCTSDAELARKFIVNPAVSVLPFPFDDQAFYPLAPQHRAELRMKHGFTPEDRVLIYAGRGMVSKNLQALLRVFKGLVHIVPNVHLICVGGMHRQGGIFAELGVMPVHFANTVDRLIDKLSLPRERLHFIGNVQGPDLRELYNIADVKVNMTMHPDENFGLSQVEAMACGTPVVGTAWGGLKDTIVDGKSGYKVSVVVNSTGVKANWWEAVNKIAVLLTDPVGLQSLRESSARHARAFYSPAVFKSDLREIVDDTCRKIQSSPRPLEATRFAQEYWDTCQRWTHGPMYRPGHRSFELYTELEAIYSGAAPEHLDPGEPVEDDQVLTLPWPIDFDADGRFRINDPHYPFDLSVPASYASAFRSVLGVLQQTPVITVGDLTRSVGRSPALNDLLPWMLSVVLLRSRPAARSISPRAVNGQLGKPMFSVQEVNPEAVDFVVFGR